MLCAQGYLHPLTLTLTATAAAALQSFLLARSAQLYIIIIRRDLLFVNCRRLSQNSRADVDHVLCDTSGLYLDIIYQFRLRYCVEP